MINQPVWRKQLDEFFTLLEFPDEPNTPHCTVRFEVYDFKQTFTFDGWGMNRDDITEEDCFRVCESLLFDSNYSIFSFASGLELLKDIEMPDPAWDYVEHWTISNALRKQEQELREFLANQEDASPEAGARIREYYREIQSLCIRGFGTLPEED